MILRRPNRQRASRRLHLCYLASTISTAVSAVSLSSFSPFASNLTPSCSAVYTTTIPGCTTTDFTSDNCSSACLNGLVQISVLVYESCAATQDYQLLVAQFLNGNGIDVLCPGVVVVTAHASTSTPPLSSFTQHPLTPTPTPTPIPTPIPTPVPTPVPAPTSPPEETGPATLSREPVQKTSLIHDTQQPPCVSPTCTERSAPQQTGPSQHTKTKASHLTRTSHITRTSMTATSRTKKPHTQTNHKPTKPASTPAPSPSSSSSAGSIDAAAAAARHCIEFGGDPFSNCPSSNSHNAASPSLRAPGSPVVWLPLVAAALFLCVLVA